MEKTVRRRKTNKSKSKHQEAKVKGSFSIKASTKDKKGKEKDSTTNDDYDEKTLKQVFFEHPLVVVLPWVLIPYILYRTFFFFVLQRPDLLLALGIQLRPAVAIEEIRQVLIVGSISSGTTQVASDLSKHLGLEIGHESSDSMSEFVRDGTVSWIHILRYLEPPSSINTTIFAYTNLCKDFVPKMGFHPRMYKPSQICSQRVTWSDCWKRECVQIVKQEWGCALPSTDHRCETPFARVLHQVRHPVRTIESLVAKFCQGGLSGSVSPAFLKFSSALFESHNFTNDNCIEAASHYVLAYNDAMLAAKDNGLVNAMFQVEAVSPCEIARLAGFLPDGDAVVYSPSAEKVGKICKRENADQAAHQLMTSKEYTVNVDLVNLDWGDFHGGKYGSMRPEGDTSLELAVRRLIERLDY